MKANIMQQAKQIANTEPIIALSIDSVDSSSSPILELQTPSLSQNSHSFGQRMQLKLPSPPCSN